jgi:hypothetical protein
MRVSGRARGQVLVRADDRAAAGHGGVAVGLGGVAVSTAGGTSLGGGWRGQVATLVRVAVGGDMRWAAGEIILGCLSARRCLGGRVDRILCNFHGCLVQRMEIKKLPSADFFCSRKLKQVPLARDGLEKLINFCRLLCRPGS